MAQHPACSIPRAASRVRIPELVGGLEHEFYFPFHIWDVIPTPLTFTPSFFKMVKLHHQPEKNCLENVQLLTQVLTGIQSWISNPPVNVNKNDGTSTIFDG